MSADVKVSATLAGHSRIDFDKKPIRKTLRQQSGQIRKVARRLVSRRAVSAAGQMPGRQSGALARAIKVRVASGGFWAKTAPQKTSEMKDFYPAFLYYGASPGLAKRGNYMTAALNERRAPARQAILAALKTSLKPR